jgi:hypothetical protein
MRRAPDWSGMLASAIVSIIMAVLILATWPGICMIVLGLLLWGEFRQHRARLHHRLASDAALTRGGSGPSLEAARRRSNRRAGSRVVAALWHEIVARFVVQVRVDPPGDNA